MNNWMLVITFLYTTQPNIWTMASLLKLNVHYFPIIIQFEECIIVAIVEFFKLYKLFTNQIYNWHISIKVIGVMAHIIIFRIHLRSIYDQIMYHGNIQLYFDIILPPNHIVTSSNKNHLTTKNCAHNTIIIIKLYFDKSSHIYKLSSLYNGLSHNTQSISTVNPLSMLGRVLYGNTRLC